MTAKGFDPDVPLKPAEARRLITEILTAGKLIFSSHAKEEMAKDKMVDTTASRRLSDHLVEARARK